MKASEVIRIIVFSLIGALAMFWLQPLIYRSRWTGFILTDVRLEPWLSNFYMTGATVVFAVSFVCTIIWYVLAAKAQIRDGKDAERWVLIWWVLLFPPVLSICVAIGFFRGTDQALLSLTTFFLINILFLYWLTTATSSPGALKFVPPGAFLVRRLFRD
ncbi:MAG TPA: hypothetical protein VK203_10360 [Nostocaceae cyanobacterium]|nr:hypothetical protein [Nostocaceae cyanobacterium]